ncbi:hypothetical protein G7046_g7972 [Stylonectria norvegica]|nr:hypothetical protein G7046_g7972 [Stylonectria norvegica]
MGPSRSRRAFFQEGSMNDRASAAPPVHFLGPEERARLERPVRPVSDDWAEKQVKKGRLLGQVWDGVRGKLGLRREADEEKHARRNHKDKAGSTAKMAREAERKDDERPTKDEVLASYHQLVSSGFFSSHAIPSSPAVYG